MNIITRKGTEIPYDVSKIVKAVTNANDTADESLKMSKTQILVVSEKAEEKLLKLGHTPHVEEIQDIVIKEIMRQQAYDVARKYTEYRFKRELARKKNTIDDAIFSLIEQKNEEIKQENSNKDSVLNSTQRDYIAGEVSKDLTRRVLLSEDIVKAHEESILHFHDADYFIQLMTNCCLVNIEDMLQNGTVISEITHTKPRSVRTAANLTSQIIAQVASNQYGGQTVTLAHLSPFIDVSRQRIRETVIREGKENGIEYSEEQIDNITASRLKKDVEAAVQMINYQLVTLMTTNGQTPFVSLFMYLNEVEEGQARDDLAMLIEEVLRQRYQGLPDKTGTYVTPAFPKLLYVLDENNAYEGSKYYYLTELAAKVVSKRMVPDFISEKVMLELKFPEEKLLSIKERRDKWGDEKIWGINPFKDMPDEDCEALQAYIKAHHFRPSKDDKDNEIIQKYSLARKDLYPMVYPCMGCRSFLIPDYIHYKAYGRFNQGVVTINLPDAAMASGRDEKLFWKILEERLELCHKALQYRNKRLLDTPSGVAPVLWQYGALSRLSEEETITPLLYDSYSTISLGYAGLYETCMYMKGKSHTDVKAKDFALAIMQKMNDKCAQWRMAENIGYSLYGTPLESTTYKFAKALQRKYGVVDEVSDHQYITNSYHVNVRENISAFDKLKFEAEFQALSPGGAISYVEVPDMQDNIPAIIKIMQFIYENIMYAELNTKSDLCEACGYDGEIEICEDENHKLYWRCPRCGNTDEKCLHVSRRTCGYIGTQFWNQGRTQEIRDRVIHVSINTENTEAADR